MNGLYIPHPARTLGPPPATTVLRFLLTALAPLTVRVSRTLLLSLVEAMKTREAETDGMLAEAERTHQHDADLTDDLRREVADLKRQVAEYDKLDAVCAPTTPREARHGRERPMQGGECHGGR